MSIKANWPIKYKGQVYGEGEIFTPSAETAKQLVASGATTLVPVKAAPPVKPAPVKPAATVKPAAKKTTAKTTATAETAQTEGQK